MIENGLLQANPAAVSLAIRTGSAARSVPKKAEGSGR
jgi:hypothetical protein